jgi:hypothetical protein
MPPVRKDTTAAEGGMRVMTCVVSKFVGTTATTGKAAPKQHEAQVEQECA